MLLDKLQDELTYRAYKEARGYVQQHFCKMLDNAHDYAMQCRPVHDDLEYSPSYANKQEITDFVRGQEQSYPYERYDTAYVFIQAQKEIWIEYVAGKILDKLEDDVLRKLKGIDKPEATPAELQV